MYILRYLLQQKNLLRNPLQQKKFVAIRFPVYLAISITTKNCCNKLLQQYISLQ